MKPLPDVDRGFGRCSCGRWAIARVNTREVCAVCLPDEMAGHRRRLVAAAATLGHNVTPPEASEGRAAPPLSIARGRRT